MLVEAFRLMQRNPKLFGAYLVGLLLPTVLDDYFSGSTGQHVTQALITFIVLMSVQNLVLAGGKAASLNSKGFRGYSFRHLVILGVVTAVAIVPMIVFGGNPFAPLTITLVMAIFCIAYPLALALFGTWPMSSIVEDRITLAMALRCGGRHFFRTFGRLFVAFAAPLIVALAAGTWVAPLDLFVNGKFSVPGAIAALIAQTAQLVSLTYVGVVLTHKYRDMFKSADNISGDIVSVFQ
jgi:hypothetical protein